MPISAGTALCLVQAFHLYELALLMTGNHHLGNALAVVDDEVFLREIDEQDHNLATIIGIDSSRSVQHRNTVLQRQSATGTYLRLESCGECDVQSCGDETAFHGTKHDGFIDVGTQIHACTLGSGVCWQRLMTFVDNLYFHHVPFI